MPKYYFHYRTDAGVVRDDQGDELEDLDAAERHAAELGQAIIGRALGEGDDPKAPRSIEITDSNGQDLLYALSCLGGDKQQGHIVHEVEIGADLAREFLHGECVFFDGIPFIDNHHA